MGVIAMKVWIHISVLEPHRRKQFNVIPETPFLECVCVCGGICVCVCVLGGC